MAEGEDNQCRQPVHNIQIQTGKKNVIEETKAKEGSWMTEKRINE